MLLSRQRIDKIVKRWFGLHTNSITPSLLA